MKQQSVQTDGDMDVDLPPCPPETSNDQACMLNSTQRANSGRLCRVLQKHLRLPLEGQNMGTRNRLANTSWRHQTPHLKIHGDSIQPFQDTPKKRLCLQQPSLPTSPDRSNDPNRCWNQDDDVLVHGKTVNCTLDSVRREVQQPQDQRIFWLRRSHLRSRSSDGTQRRVKNCTDTKVGIGERLADVHTLVHIQRPVVTISLKQPPSLTPVKLRSPLDEDFRDVHFHEAEWTE